MIFGLACLLTAGMSAQKKLPYQNLKLPVETRVKDLLGRMTIEEKVEQLCCSTLSKYSCDNRLLIISWLALFTVWLKLPPSHPKSCWYFLKRAIIPSRAAIFPIVVLSSNFVTASRTIALTLW